MPQPKIPPTPAGTSLAGKVALITGASSGLGLETARQYLLLNVDRLIITARSAAKGQAAVKTLRDDTDVAKTNPNATIDAFELELEDYDSVVRFCKRVTAEVPTLHILFNNAGVTETVFNTTKDGHEGTMQGLSFSRLATSSQHDRPLALLPYNLASL
jgi:NAD(P)-dependent dehydrogenase (short-subunit alcohol dehydrogenase family)